MTVAMPECSTRSALCYKVLLTNEQWEWIVERVLQDHEFVTWFGTESDLVRREYAERITDQALAFLTLYGLCGRGSSYSPSKLVDIAWHIMLEAPWYWDICFQIAGCLIEHHVLDDPVHGDDGNARTVTAMQDAGITVDTEMWLGDTGPCNGRCDWPPRH